MTNTEKVLAETPTPDSQKLLEGKGYNIIRRWKYISVIHTHNLLFSKPADIIKSREMFFERKEVLDEC